MSSFDLSVQSRPPIDIFRMTVLLYLNGILNGPLNWDVDLVRKALGGLTPNDVRISALSLESYLS